MTERDETTRPLTAETMVGRLRITARTARRVEELQSLSNLLDEAADALDAREAQTCSRCKWFDDVGSREGVPAVCRNVNVGALTNDGAFYPDAAFGCNQWAAKEQP